jgi:hypothetical protein
MGARYHLQFSSFLAALLVMTSVAGSATGEQEGAPAQQAAQPGDDVETRGLPRVRPEMRLPQRVPINADWAQVGDRVKRAIQNAVNVWNTNARLVGVVINAQAAMGGQVSAPPLYNLLLPAMIQQGVPMEIGTPISKAISDQWSVWSNTIKVPGLPWYPAFIAFPGPVAPPTPNTPVPLSVLSQSIAPVSAGSFETALRNQLGPLVKLDGALDAIRNIANYTEQCNRVLRNGMVTNVLGTGPVPSFAPPFVPVGSVVGGTGAQPGPLTSGPGCPAA